MSSSTNTINFLLNIQGENLIFNDENFKTIEIKGIKTKIISAKTNSSVCQCPKCNSNNIVKNGTRKANVRLMPIQKHSLNLSLTIQRYVCKDCKKSFSDENKLVKKNCTISNNLKIGIAEDLKSIRSIKDISNTYNVSSSTVMRVMKDFYPDTFKLNVKLPEAICIDEFKSVKNVNSAMSFIFADAISGNIIDIVEDRKLKSLTDYFLNFDIEERKKVKYICMDIYTPYMSLVKKCFPNANIVLDRFHIINNIVRALNSTRIKIMNSYKKNSFVYKLFKKFWKLLLMDDNKLDKESKYYRLLHGGYTGKQIVNKMLKLSDELNLEYWIYQNLQYFLKKNDFKFFEDELIESLTKDRKSISPKMLTALKTCKKYLNYIENAMNTGYSNGLIEGINNKIKLIKRVGFGYRNFENLKKRVLIINGIVNIQG